MYDTSVTIIIISPNMKKSKWIDWEIEYNLKNINRKGPWTKLYRCFI
ncbi:MULTISPECIES: TIR domain-containing protein [unclassified Bacillus (in: firmicutes)]|nr:MULTISPECIES: TIR domain-containing protein [unclassified Bacillus (in: firmicutes)]